MPRREFKPVTIKARRRPASDAELLTIVQPYVDQNKKMTYRHSPILVQRRGMKIPIELSSGVPQIIGGKVYFRRYRKLHAAGMFIYRIRGGLVLKGIPHLIGAERSEAAEVLPDVNGQADHS